MNTLIATDLDRTMIYSRGALSLDASHEGNTAGLLCVEMYNGEPLSYVTSDAERMLERLAMSAVVVPTTTRTIAQFQRIALPGAPWRYAITSNGGNILVDGVPDTQWRSAIDSATTASGATLVEVTAELNRRIDDGWAGGVRVADELFCYVVVDLAAQPSDFLEEWGEWCEARGWGASQQGRKIYTMPNAVCKSLAVGEVRSRLIADGTLTVDSELLAAGDGSLDAQMLTVADAAIRPRHGELESLGWQYPSVEVTGSKGIAAGEEILRWFAARTTPRPAPAPTPTWPNVTLVQSN